MEFEKITETLQRIENKLDSIVFTQEKDFFSVREAEQTLGISRSTFDRYRKIGKIKATAIGRQLKITRDEIERIKREGFL